MGVVKPHTILARIEHAINKLVIHPVRLNDCFENHNYIRLLNMTTLHVTDTISYYLIQTIVDRCPQLQNIRLLCNFDMIRCLQSLSDLKLTSLDIEYEHGTQVIDNEFILFMSRQSHLKELSLRGWNNLQDGTLAKIIDENRNISSLDLSSSSVSGEIFSGKIKLPELLEFTVQSSKFDVGGLKSLAYRVNNL